MFKHLLLFLVIVLAGVGVLFLMPGGVTFLQQRQPVPPDWGTPPPDARFLGDEATAEGVMGLVAMHRKEADRDAAARQVVGLWSPPRGWEGEVVDITKEARGTAIRMAIHNGPGIGGDMYLIAIVADDAFDAAKGDRATVSGRVDAVEVTAGAGLPINRVILSPAKVVSVLKFRR